MATNIRAELSTKNPYWLERHRYYELKHFCLQYPLWKKELVELNLCSYGSIVSVEHSTGCIQNPTVEQAERRTFYGDRVSMIERTAVKAAGELSDYILKGVTEEVPFYTLQTVHGIPCCRDTYYDLYRKFFWLLSQERQ